ncbi:hypothetical protein POV27_14520 [Aureisphaera galaxeae]|uniref:hypothetical protein n=1 Tax=Aureisphaera galaxeae TaxID=1538023 RepID=UPI00234FC993|nr:hypothetical protein [Aureisphaera galaxeae]MDC8005273.1 hypothetical protein [Aureisphaera galaxeae]
MEIKKTIICNRVDDYTINEKINTSYIPKAGDVAIFKVLEIGKHNSVQGVNGNNCYLFPGDYVMAAFGNRYATDQFEGYVPTEYHEEYHILGKGGAVGILASMHQKLEHIGTTNLELIGYATDKNDKVINTKYYHAKANKFSRAPRDPKIVLSLGSSMDSGKTTTAAFLARGLKSAGKKVAYIKLTGTVYTKDRHFARDCGAHLSIDFSTYGFPSTYLCGMQELLDLFETLMNHSSRIEPDYVIIEIADGLVQRETAMLLEHSGFMNQIDHVIFSAADSLGILSGIHILESLGIQAFAVGGLFTASPLFVKEVESTIKLPVLDLEKLASPNVLTLLEQHLQETA